MTWAPLSILRDIGSFSPCSTAGVPQSQVHGPRGEQTLFLIILYVNCYCGMVKIGPQQAHDALMGEDGLIEFNTVDVETDSCEIAHQAEDERQADRATQDGDRAAGSLERAQYRRRGGGSPARRRAIARPRLCDPRAGRASPRRHRSCRTQQAGGTA